MKKNEWFKISEKEEAEFSELNISVPEEAIFAFYDGEECTRVDSSRYCWMTHDRTYFNWLDVDEPEWIASELETLRKIGGLFYK